MTKKQNIKKIVQFIDEIEWLFQIQNYDRRIETMKEEHEFGAAADVRLMEDYQRIRIRIFPCFFKEDLAMQRKMLLHELCHTITIPMANLAEDLRSGKLVTEDAIDTIHERSTSQIENILNGLLQGKFKYAREAYDNYLK